MVSPTATTINERYALHEMLGEGGMGAVYRATDRLTGKRVALKRVIAGDALLPNASDTESLRLSLAHEFEILASLRHPNIIGVLDYGFDEQKNPYFTMELLEEAQTLIDDGKEKPTPQRILYLIQVLQALAYLHRRGVIHRDLKPGNVLVKDETVRVLDFGLSVEKPIAEGVAGTLRYMAPEVLKGAGATALADLFAVGVLAYEMLAGKHPFQAANTAAIISAVLKETPDPTPIGDEKIAEFVFRLLEKQPLERYPNADSAALALSAAADVSLKESSAIRESFLNAARFIGREAEFSRLDKALGEALAGQGSTWLLGGESGVGKSRLANEIAIRALIRGALVMRGQAVEGGGLPYQVWREPLRHLILITPIEDTDASVLKPIVPEIGTLLGREIPDAPDTDPKSAQRRLMVTIASLLHRQTRPIVILLEDLHWTEESLDVFAELIPMAAALPVMLIGTYRHDERPDLPQRLPESNRLMLERLDDAAIKALSFAILGEAGANPEVVSLLQRETEGNALFIVETVRALADISGRLEDIGRKTLPQSIFTGGIQRVLEFRLGRVPETARPLLRLAAVAGRQIDLPVLKAAALQADLEDWLTVCANAAVLAVRGDQWHFAHDKMRTAVLAALSEDETRTLHRQIAEAIERVHGDVPGYEVVLASHWGAAQDRDKELHYTLKAADHAVITAAFSELLRLTVHARNLLSETSDTSPALIAEATRKIGIAHEGMSNYPEAERHFTESLTQFRAINDELGITRALAGLAAVTNQTGRYEDARRYCNESLEISRRIGDQEGIARAISGLGIAADYSGQAEEAVGHYNTALAMARERGDHSSTARMLANLGFVAYAQGRNAEAIAQLEEARTIAEAIGDRMRAAYSLMTLGLVSLNQGHNDQAAVYLEDSLRRCREMGDRLGISRALNNLSEIAQRRGEYAESIRILEESLQICQQIGNQRGVALVLHNRGSAHARLKEYDKARDDYRQSLSITEVLGDKYIALYNRFGIGENALNQNQIDEAETELRAAIKEGTVLGVEPLVLRAIASLARVALMRGNPQQAVQWLTMVNQHPAVEAEVVKENADLLATARESLGSEAFERDSELGKALTIGEVMKTLRFED